MALFFLLFVVLVTGANTPYNNEITFSRVDVTSDVHKHLSVKVYGQADEMPLMHMMVLFHSPKNLIGGREINADLGWHEKKKKNINASLLVYGQYHNALIIGAHAYHLYHKITKDSRFEYNNEIGMSARGKDFVLPFSVASAGEQWAKLTKQTTNSLASLVDFTSSISLQLTLPPSNPTAASPTYHAVLSLGRYSSIWDQYNVMLLTHYTVSMLFRERARLTNTLGQFTGLARIQCVRTQHALDQRCLVEKPRGLWVSGKFYPSYNVAIDLHSSLNYLPTDLFFDYKAASVDPEGTLRFNLTREGKTQLNELPINNKFVFMLNEHSNDVILGVDLLRYFPQVEYSVKSERIHLWYHANLQTHPKGYRGVVIVFILITAGVIFCYIHWRTSTNYRLFKFITLYSRVGLRYIYFEHRQAITEVVMIVFAMPILFAILLFIDSTSSLQFQRTLLLLVMCFYLVTLLLCALIMSPDPLDKSLGGGGGGGTRREVKGKADQVLEKDYFLGGGHERRLQEEEEDEVVVADTDFDEVKEEYIDGYSEKRHVKMETYRVIVRCTALVELVWIEMLMMLNFSTLQNHLFFILFFVISLLYIYYNSYFVSLSLLYCMAVTRVPRRFTAFLVSQCVALVFFVSWALYCFYWDYFRSISTIYSETEIVVFLGTLMTMILLFGIFNVYSSLDEIVRTHYT